MHASSLRYSAAHLFYAFALTASSTALFGWYGLPVSLFILLVWWQVISGARREASEGNEAAVFAYDSVPREHNASTSRSGFSKPELLIVILIVGLLIGLLLPASSDSDPMRHAEISMKMAVQAIREYQAAHGRLPPPVVRDEDGRLMHSWRALVLPYLDEPQLAAAYRFDEPWDSPHNASLAIYRPWHFRAYYPNHEINDISTSLHAMSIGDSLVLFEHEELASSWLEPTHFDASALAEFEQLPDHEAGFWRQGFFSSSYRGRLMVTPSASFCVHPAKAAEIEAALASPPESEPPHLVGEQHRLWHYGNAFRLAFFLVVALYPLRWLHQLGAKNRH